VAIRAFPIATYCHTRAKNGGFSAKKQRNTYCFRRKTLKKWRKRLAVSNIFCIFATNRKNSCRFHLEAYDSCETTFLYLETHKQQCPLAQECAHYLSVTYKKPEQTKGYAIYPDAYHDNKCEHFLQLQMMKMAYGFTNILEELKRKDEATFRIHMTSYFGSKTSYYRYKLGQTGLVPEQQQYVLKWCQQHGYTNMRFDRYAEEVNY